MRTTTSGGAAPAAELVAGSLPPARPAAARGLGIHEVVVRYAAPGRRRAPLVAVDGVTLDVAPGEVVALLGPSGSGKSSLLRAVAGLEPLAAGDVTWDGASVAGVPVHRRGFGLLFQDGQLFAHRDVAGNVGYGLRGAGTAERIAALLELVGLPGQQRRDPATLSGGERQRVALARALAPRPRLLLLDEPLSALDRALRERLAQDLRAALLATGTTAVLVTHDQDEAFAVADRVAVMSAGRLLQVAAPGELWRAPGSREVAAFLGYEAFLAAGAPAAAPWRSALRLAATDGRTLALAAGALVVRSTRSADALGPRGRRWAPSEGGGGMRAAEGIGSRTAEGIGSLTAEGIRVPAADGIGSLTADGIGVPAAEGIGVPAAEGIGSLVGVVVAIGARRGRADVTVDVAGVGRLTASAPAGWTAPVGTTVGLAVDPDGVALLR